MALRHRGASNVSQTLQAEAERSTAVTTWKQPHADRTNQRLWIDAHRAQRFGLASAATAPHVLQRQKQIWTSLSGTGPRLERILIRQLH